MEVRWRLKNTLISNILYETNIEVNIQTKVILKTQTGFKLHVVSIRITTSKNNFKPEAQIPALGQEEKATYISLCSSL